MMYIIRVRAYAEDPKHGLVYQEGDIYTNGLKGVEAIIRENINIGNKILGVKSKVIHYEEMDLGEILDLIYKGDIPNENRRQPYFR